MINTAIEKELVYLYHYQKFKEEYVADLLLNNRIKFSNPRSFNDPWDCRINFSKKILDDPEKYKTGVEYAIDLQRRHLQIPEPELLIRRERLTKDRVFMEAIIDEYTQSMNDVIENDYRVYCLSSEPANCLMWAHYSDSHKGLCFGFKTKSDVFSEAMEVNYSEFYPELNHAEEDEIKFFRDALLTKAEAWSYENEFRLIAKTHDSESFFTLENGYLSFSPEDLVCVIIGCSALEDDIQMLKKILNKRNLPVKLFQARPASDKYSLKIQDF